MSQGWITVKEALERDPEFFNRRPEASWRWDAVNSMLVSKFGTVEIRVAVNDKGEPEFDRAICREAPGMFAVVYGVDQNGVHHVGVVEETRQFADTLDGLPADPPLRFAQPCTVGLMDERMLGKEAAKRLETPAEAAEREAGEEVGVSDEIISVEEFGYSYPNPALVASYDKLVEIKVDLEKFAENTGSEARIHRVHFLPVRELMDRIAAGTHEGVEYNSAVANHAFLVWLCRHPEAQAS